MDLIKNSVAESIALCSLFIPWRATSQDVSLLKKRVIVDEEMMKIQEIISKMF